MAWFPRFGVDLGNAQRRIRALLDDESLVRDRKDAIQAESRRLRQEGWRPASATAAPARGPATADAARVIQADMDDADAYRAEASRRLAQQTAQVDAAPDGQGAPLPFKAAGPVRPAPWETRITDMARYLNIDPDLAAAAGPDVIPVLMGVYGYRHLDRKGQYQVLRAAQKLQGEHPDLYGRIIGQVGSIVANPYAETWSLSDDDLNRRIEEDNRYLGWMDIFGDAQDAGSVAAPFVTAASAPKFTPLAAGLTATLLGTKYMTKGDLEMMQEEQARRRAGQDPFR